MDKRIMQYPTVLIGAGMIGKILGDAIQHTPAMQLVGYSDIDRKKKIYDNFPFFIDYRKMIQELCPKIAVIATPNHTHADIIKYCIDHNMHVACEKPFTLTYEMSLGLIDYAYTRNCIVETIYHRSFNSNIADIRDKKNIKKIHVRYLENITDHTDSYRYKDKKLSGGGCIFDNGINVLDILTRLCPDLACENVQIRYNDVLPNDIESNSVIQLTTPNSHIDITIELDRLYPGEKKDIAITHTDGTTTYRDMLMGYHGFKASLPHEYNAYMQHFIEKIIDGKNKKDENTIKNMSLLQEIYTHGSIGKN